MSDAACKQKRSLAFYPHTASHSWQLLFFVRSCVIVRGSRPAGSHWRCLDWFWSGIEIFRHFNGAILSNIFDVAFDLVCLKFVCDLLSRFLIARLSGATLFKLDDVIAELCFYQIAYIAGFLQIERG